MICHSFRPLTGINFNNMKAYKGFNKDSFRPLTGINFNRRYGYMTLQRIGGFRPLTGINFNKRMIPNIKSAPVFPSPHGDKFQL